MENNKYSTEIREVFNEKYLKVFFLDDSVASEAQELLLHLKEVKSVNITDSLSKSHPGHTLTIKPKSMVDVKTMQAIVEKALDNYFSGIKEVKTDIMTEVGFKNIEQKILKFLDDAKATIDVSVAWFTSPLLLSKLVEKKKEGCKVRVIIDANYTNQVHGVDLSQLEHKAIKAERKGIMHYKFCVIDNNTIIHGSYNWTTNAETKNNEEISIHKNYVDMASEYTREFNRLWNLNK